MTFQNELKPPLGEALEHYGVKGMRWGVRRDQRTLDRLAGRKSVGSRVGGAIKKSAVDQVDFYRKPAKAALAKRAAKPPSRSKQIKTARKDILSKRRQEIKNAPTIKAKASIFLNGEFSKHLSETYRADPNRRIAFQQTTGESVATALLAVPSFGTSLAITLGTRSMVKAIANDQELAAIKLAAKKNK